MAATWHRVLSHRMVPAARTGWRGVWDATVAWVTGNPRRDIAVPMIVTFYIKGTDPGDVNVRINRVSTEFSDE